MIYATLEVKVTAIDGADLKDIINGIMDNNLIREGTTQSVEVKYKEAVNV
jgi:hypothetical protein